MAKTETITIRVSATDKRLISNLAWASRMSVAELLTHLAYKEMDYMEKNNLLPRDLTLMDLEYDLKQKSKKELREITGRK